MKPKEDHISISGIEIETIIGILPHERSQPQTVEIDLTFSLDLGPAGKSCDISHTVDYAALTEEITFIFQASEFLLLETAAYTIAHYALAPPIGSQRPLIDQVKVDLRKPKALGGRGIPSVSVTLDADSPHFDKSKHDGYITEALFECKDSALHRIERTDGRQPVPPINEDYTFKDYDLKTSGPHFLRVYRI